MDWDLVRVLAGEAGLFVAGAILGALSFRTIALPLLYALPRAVAWVVQGRLRWSVVFRLLASLIWWGALFALGAYLLARFAPGAWERLYSSPPFYVGLWLGISLRAFRTMGSKSGQRALQDRFLNSVKSHLIERERTQEEQMGENIYERVWHLSRGGTRYGPYSFDDLCRRAKRGDVRDDDLLWRPGVAEWADAPSVLGSVKKGRS